MKNKFPLIGLLLGVAILVVLLVTNSQPKRVASNSESNATNVVGSEASVAGVTKENKEEKAAKVAGGKSAFSLAAESASVGKFTEAAEYLHTSYVEGSLNLKKIYSDSRFSKFLGSPEHASFLLIIGEVPDENHGFPPISR